MPAAAARPNLLRAAAFDAGHCGRPLVHAVLDLDAASPDGVPAAAYLDKVLLELRQRDGETGARRAAAIRALVDEAKVTLAFNLSGWDRLAWLPLAIELELPVAGLRDLFFRHWTPDQARPAPERFLETLRELAASIAERHGGGGLLLQIPEQRQPEASVRDLLLQWLPSLPGLVLAFTQHDAGRDCDYQDQEPLRLALQPLMAADLDQRLTNCLGAQALPRPLLQAVATRAQGNPGLAALTLVDLAQRDLIGPDPAGIWRLRDQAGAPDKLDELLGPGLFQPLHGLIEHIRADAGPEAAADLRGFLDQGCLCGRNIPFGIVADCLGLDEARRDRLLDLLDAHLVEPQAEPATADAPVPEPQLDYLGCRHPDLPDQEVFRFRNPLLAQHLRNRQSRLDRQQRAQALLARLAAVLPPYNRGVAELHLAVLDHVGDEPRRRALDGELFYWLDAAHARSAGRELVADLKARRVSPEAVWGAIEQNQERWPVWRRLAWLEAFGRQPHGVPEAIRGVWLNRLAVALYNAGDLDRALGVAEESLDLVRAVEGANSANAAAALGLTASILEALGQPGPALARHEEALAIRRKALPAGHPAIAVSLNNIAVVLNALGRHQEALEQNEEALLIQRKALPAGHPEIAVSLNNIAEGLDALGRHQEALARHEEALLINRKALPAGHPDIASSLNNVACALDALGRHQEALERHEQALAMWRKGLPAGHPNIASSLENIGGTLMTLGRPAETKTHLEEAFAIHAARTAGDPAVLIHYCRRYAILAAKHGDHPGALYWLDRALDLIPTQPTAGLPDPDALRREITQQRADLTAAGTGSDPPAPPGPDPRDTAVRLASYSFTISNC